MDIESTSILLAGGMFLLAGALRKDLITFIAGALIFISGVVSWTTRRIAHLKQRSQSPLTVFVSEEGINAALPGNMSVRMCWSGITAREFRYFRGGLRGKRHARDKAMRGMLLKDAIGERSYVTSDLDGYKELVEILVELDVPVHAAGGAFRGATGSLADWRQNLERRAN